MRLSLFASCQQWIDMIILWCFGPTPTIVFYVMIFMWREPLADLIVISERRVSHFYLKHCSYALRLLFMITASVWETRCNDYFSPVLYHLFYSTSLFFCLLVFQCVNVLTLMPQAFHFIQYSLIAIELALCLLYAPRTTYSSSLEQTYTAFEAFGPHYYGGIVFVHL